MQPSKRPVSLFHYPLFTQCATPNVPFSYSIPRYSPNAPLQTFRLAIPFPAIYLMRPSNRQFYLFHSPIFTQCALPNIRFSYSIPRYLLNTTIQTSRLAIPFPAIYPMRPSKRPVYLLHSTKYTQCPPPNVPFDYSIFRYLLNAQLQSYSLAIPFPAIYPMRPSKRPV